MWNLEIQAKPINYHDALKVVVIKLGEATVNYLKEPSNFGSQFCLAYWLYAHDRITKEAPGNV